MMKIYEKLEQLIQYGLRKKLIEDADVEFVRNDLLAILGLEDWKSVAVEPVEDESPTAILADILDWAAENGILPHNTVTYRDLLDTELMRSEERRVGKECRSGWAP